MFDDLIPQQRGGPNITIKPTRSAPANATPVPQGLSFDDLIPAQTEQPAPQSVGAGEAFGRGVAQGATLNFYDELRGLMEAGGLDPKDPASLASLVQGAYKYWTGDPAAEASYNAATTRERSAATRAQEQHPITSIAGNVLGAVALPIGAALQGATLPARVGRGAAVGAGTGAAYGAGEGDGALDRVSRAAVGGVIGAGVGGAVPVAVEGVVRGARAAAEPFANAVRGVRNVDDEAARRVATALDRDIQADPNAVSRLTQAEFAAGSQQGGPARVIDIGGDTTRALARSSANTSPEGRGLLNRTINDRFEGQAGRIINWLRQTFHYPNANAQREAIEEAARQVNRPAYAHAMQEGSRGVWSPELQRLAGAPAIQEAARSSIPSLANRGISEGFRAPRGNPLQFDRNTGRASLRRLQNGNEVVPDLRFWDQVKRGLDGMVGKAERYGDTAKVQELTELRAALVSQLDTLVPSYAQARAGAAHFFGARDALEAGQNFVTANMRNDEFRRAFGQMSQSERQLFQDGFVSRLIDQINSVGDRRSVLNQIAASPQAREKMRMVLGAQRADELEAGLRVEGIMDLARGAVQGNSTTARQLQELGLAGGAYGLSSGGNINPLNPDPQALMAAALVYGAARGRNAVNERLARRVAEMLVSSDPRVILQGVRVAARNRQMFNSLRATDQRLARIGGEQGGGTSIIQGGVPARANDEQPEPVRVINQ